jgi:hypothetical protein
MLLALLAWPAASLADHITIQASVVAVLKERFSSTSWLVEVKWSITCVGAGPKGASYSGNLNLVDVATHESIYLGGVSSASGKAQQLVSIKSEERFLRPELKISCFDNDTLHGANTETGGDPVRIPARYDDGEGGHGGGGGGGGGSGGGDPSDPMRGGGCRLALQGTDKPETLTGTGAGDIVFGYGGGDLIRGASGHDCLLGGRGNDRLLGEAGDDRLTGGSGNDVLTGGPGTNGYDAGRGSDVVNAANGRRETVRCGPGKDRARVDRGDRVISCERVTRVS